MVFGKSSTGWSKPPSSQRVIFYWPSWLVFFATNVRSHDQYNFCGPPNLKFVAFWTKGKRTLERDEGIVA